jgi:Protein of unknown function (DUF3110)
MRVFVLLFNANTDNEGIHTISIGSRNLVLMFEQEDDALRYAMLLEAQDFPVPSVEAIDKSAGYECYLIPENFVPETEFERLLLAPPERNLEQTDWETGKKPQDDESDLSSEDLDRIRRQLEGLL